MIYRYYLAPFVPATWLNGKYALEVLGNKLGTIIDTHAGEGYFETHFKNRGATLCLCWAEQASHDIAEADPEIAALSPLFDSEKEAVAWLEDGPLPDVGKELEAFGIPADWLTPAHTARDLIGFLCKLAAIEQVNKAVKNATVDALTDGTKIADGDSKRQVIRDMVANTDVGEISFLGVTL